MATTAVAIDSTHELAVRTSDKDNLQALGDVIAEYSPSFYRKAFRQLGNSADAEDALQDAFLSAYKHLNQFKGQAKMSTWLTSIVLNSARMQLRRRRRQPHLSLDDEYQAQDSQFSRFLSDHGSTPEEKCRTLEFTERVDQMMTRLSPALRETFQLFLVQGLTLRETAELLGVPDGTVKARVARARATLRRLMRKKPLEKSRAL